mmetsp:Transcript_4875/g.15176  ORF Transcript_4875/g.15176 Transcript_4875/m.15176 type:complete len:374 (-) Transcript_4875:1580-2701(-)
MRQRQPRLRRPRYLRGGLPGRRRGGHGGALLRAGHGQQQDAGAGRAAAHDCVGPAGAQVARAEQRGAAGVGQHDGAQGEAAAGRVQRAVRPRGAAAGRRRALRRAPLELPALHPPLRRQQLGLLVAALQGPRRRRARLQRLRRRALDRLRHPVGPAGHREARRPAHRHVDLRPRGQGQVREAAAVALLLQVQPHRAARFGHQVHCVHVSLRHRHEPHARVRPGGHWREPPFLRVQDHHARGAPLRPGPVPPLRAQDPRRQLRLGHLRPAQDPSGRQLQALHRVRRRVAALRGQRAPAGGQRRAARHGGEVRRHAARVGQPRHLHRGLPGGRRRGHGGAIRGARHGRGEGADAARRGAHDGVAARRARVAHVGQ